jgi:ETC complex I subunit conserved region
MLRAIIKAAASSAPALTTGWARGTKQSTYLKGLEVDPEAATNLPKMLNGLLEKAQDVLPVEAAYRGHVEAYCNRFLKIITEAPSQADAEQVLGRQYEEIELDVSKESQLVDMMAEWKPWAVPDTHVPKVFAQLTDIPENVREFREFQHDLGTKE